MPQASAFTNSVRAYSEGRNNKVQTPKNSLNIDNLRGLSCSSIDWSPIRYAESCKKCSNLPKAIGLPYSDIAFSNMQLVVSWSNILGILMKVTIYDNANTVVATYDAIYISDGSLTTTGLTLTAESYYAILAIQETSSSITTSLTINPNYSGGGK